MEIPEKIKKISKEDMKRYKREQEQEMLEENEPDTWGDDE